MCVCVCVCVHYFEVESLHHICNAAENTKKRGRTREAHVPRQKSDAVLGRIFSLFPFFSLAASLKKGAFILESIVTSSIALTNRLTSHLKNHTVFLKAHPQSLDTSALHTAPCTELVQMWLTGVTFTDKSLRDFTSYKLMHHQCFVVTLHCKLC